MEYVTQRLLPNYTTVEESESEFTLLYGQNTSDQCEEVHFTSEKARIVFQHLIFWLTRDTSTSVWKFDRTGGWTIIDHQDDLDEPDQEMLDSLFEEIWNNFAKIECLSTAELINIIRMRGDRNIIDTSNNITNFDVIMTLLPKLEHKRCWPYGVVLMNNILAVQELRTGDVFLVKGMRPAWTREATRNNNIDQKVPCIDEHSRSESIERRFMQIEFKGETDCDPEKAGKKKPPTMNWFKIWIKSMLHCRVGLLHMDPYPINQTRSHGFKPLECIDRYTRRQDINMFTGYIWTLDQLREAYESVKGKQTVEIVKHLMFSTICDSNKDSFECLREFCASVVQQPGLKTQFCVYIKGQKGVGKSLFASIFTQLFGSHAAYLAGESIDGDFNGFLKNGILFVNLDEFPTKGANNLESLKSHITQNTIKCRAMYTEGVSMQNMMNFIATTNNDPVNLNITADERRFLLLKCKEFNGKDLEKQKKKMTLLHDEYLFDRGTNIGYRAVIYWLLTQVKVEPSLHQRVPKTDYFRQIMEENLDWIIRWWKTVLERGGIQGQLLVGTGSNERRYDWAVDMNMPWSWKSLRDESDGTNTQTKSIVPRGAVSNRSKNADIETLKSVVMVGNQRGSTFRLQPHAVQVQKFKTMFPWVKFQFDHEELVVDEDLYATAKRRSCLNERAVKRARSETAGWTTDDFHFLIADANEALLQHRLRIAPNKKAKIVDVYNANETCRAPRVVIEELSADEAEEEARGEEPE